MALVMGIPLLAVITTLCRGVGVRLECGRLVVVLVPGGAAGPCSIGFCVVRHISGVTVGMRGLRRVRQAGDTYGEAVVIGALGILVAFMTHNLFEDLHVLNMGIQWGAALALFTVVGGQW